MLLANLSQTTPQVMCPTLPRGREMYETTIDLCLPLWRGLASLLASASPVPYLPVLLQSIASRCPAGCARSRVADAP